MYVAIVFVFLFGVCWAANPEPIEILSEEKEMHPDGHYNYKYESADGTSQEQSASVKIVEDVPVLSIVGEYSYRDAEGVLHSVKYTADETGYHAESEDLPVVPEIPQAIQEGLKYIVEHPYLEDK